MKLDEIYNKHHDLIASFRVGRELTESDELYVELYEYYLCSGEMPYGVAKARTGDPLTWVVDKLHRDKII